VFFLFILAADGPIDFEVIPPPLLRVLHHYLRPRAHMLTKYLSCHHGLDIIFIFHSPYQRILQIIPSTFLFNDPTNNPLPHSSCRLAGRDSSSCYTGLLRSSLSPTPPFNNAKLYTIRIQYSCLTNHKRPSSQLESP
jgi:hypothetical protein